MYVHLILNYVLSKDIYVSVHRKGDVSSSFLAWGRHSVPTDCSRFCFINISLNLGSLGE